MHDVESVLDRIEALRGPRSVSELVGGLTNRNLRVDVGGRSFVVRLSSPASGLLAVDRQIEYLNTVAASATVGAGVVDYLPGEGVLVIDWIEGQTLTAASLRDEQVLVRLAAACRRLHAGPPFANRFDMFALQQQYLSVVLERGFRLPPRYREFEPHVERIRRALAAEDVGLAPCNNDLLAGNIIDPGTDLRLIDYEYSGANDPYFELGNAWSESTLPVEHLEVLVSAYDGVHDPAHLARARLLGLMSKYGWMLWASIQEGISDIEFDFWSWGMEKYERAVSEFDSPDFGRLLDAAGRR